MVQIPLCSLADAHETPIVLFETAERSEVPRNAFSMDLR